MKSKQLNKRSRRRKKINLLKKGAQKNIFSKRVGGIIGNSVLIENRNVTANDISGMSKGI